MSSYNILQDLRQRKITKITEIEKIINCPCGRGVIKLKMIYVDPETGKVTLSYGNCTNGFCEYRKGILKFTKIVIKKLKLGE